MIVSGEAELSVRGISRRTGVPESTLRYYRDVFPEQIPTVGRGRKRRASTGGRSRLSANRPALRGRRIPPRRPQGAEARRAGGRRRRPRKPEGEHASGGRLESAYALTRRAGSAVGTAELEDLVAAMLARDRALVSMHRELLQVLEGLVRALVFMGSGGEMRHGQLVAGMSRAAARPDESTPDEGADAAGGDYEYADVTDELARLKETLASERKTVERLRRARLELERRLRQLERDGEGRDR